MLERHSTRESPFETIGPTAEEAQFSMVVVQANGIKSTPFSTELKEGSLGYFRLEKQAHTVSLEDEAQLTSPNQRSYPIIIAFSSSAITTLAYTCIYYRVLHSDPEALSAMDYDDLKCHYIS